MDNVRTTVLPSNPKRPRVDCITAGNQEEGHSPFEIPQSWRTEATGSSRMNLDHSAQRHSKEPQWEKHNGGETRKEDDFTAVANASVSHATDSLTATSHTDGDAITPRFSAGDVSSDLVVGVEEEEEERRDANRAEEPASRSRQEERPSASVEPGAPQRSDTGAVAVLRRVTPLTWPGKSPERRWPAGAGRSPADDDEGGRCEEGGDGGEAHAIPPSEGKAGEVKGRCVYGDAGRDGRGGDSHGRSRSSLGGEGEGDEEGDGQSLRELSPLKGGGGGDEEALGHAVPGDDVIMMSSRCNEEINRSGNVVGVEQKLDNNGKNGENETTYDAEALREIKETENSSSHSSPGCIGSLIITHDALLDGNVPDTIATKSGLGLVIDDLRGGEGRLGTGKIIADTPHKMADHACETMMPAQITQGPFEKDNDAGPFSVIDSAIRSQAGRQDEEKSSTSQSAAGVGLSPSGAVTLARGTSLTPIPENLIGRRWAHDTKEIPSSDQAWRPDNRRGGVQLEGETHDTCRSATEEMCFSIFTNESLNETQNEIHRETGHAVVPPCPACPANSPFGSFEYIPPGGETEVLNIIPAGAFGEHQEPTDWSPTGPDPLNAQVETKMTERILVKTVSFEGEQLSSVINSPEKIRQYKLTAGTNQHQNAASGVPAFGLVTNWINATMGKSCYQSVVPSLHPEDKLGTAEACVLSPTLGYRPAINMTDMIEHHQFPQHTDAVVPVPRCTIHSITYRHDAHIRFTQECFQPSPPPPSALVLSDRKPAAVDTFEKIPLHLWDDDCGDEGPGHSPLLTGSLELLKSSRRQLTGTQPGVESNGQRELAKEGEVPGTDAVTKVQPQREDRGGKRCFDSINRPCEIPSGISAVSPVFTLAVSQPVPATCRVSQAVFNNRFSAAADNGDDDDVPLAIKTCQEFEMKQQFDEVVQELQQFFAIGTNDPSDSLSSEWGSVLNGPEETRAPGHGEDRTTPMMESLRGTSSAGLSLRIEDNDEDSRGVCVLMDHGCSPEPVVPPHDPGTRELDQQVPPPDWSQPCLDGEDSMYSVGKLREENKEEEDNIIERSVSSVSESRKKPEGEPEGDPSWTPSFQSHNHHRQSDPQRRLQPLRTCARPIRIGLSKRAKTSHLHRNHPYK